jgi:hypothetical protein
MPQFNDPIFEELYKKDVFIETSVLNQILSKGKDAIADLELIIDDWFDNRKKYEKLEEHDRFFVVHALFLLYTLNAEQSFPKILEIFKKGSDYWEDWLDLTWNDLEPVAIRLGKGHVKLLTDLIADHSQPIDLRSSLNTVLTQIALHYADKRPAIVNFYKGYLKSYIAEHDKLDKLYPSKRGDSLDIREYLATMCIDIQNAFLTDLRPEILQCFKHGMLDDMLYDSEKDIAFKPQPIAMHKDIFDQYEEFKNYPMAEDSPYNPDPEGTRRRNRAQFEDMASSLFEGLQNIGTDTVEDEGDDDLPADNPETMGRVFPFGAQVLPPSEPGRNDPCPCGSGKKYKKCHGS